MAGRPTIRTPENAGKVIAALKGGATYRMAAAAIGCDETTLIRWRHADADFASDCARAELAGSLELLKKIKAAASADWRAAAWILERRYPRDYGRHLLEVTGAEGGALDVKTEIRFVWSDDTDDNGGHGDG